MLFDIKPRALWVRALVMQCTTRVG
jgi:hypothetical protein